MKNSNQKIAAVSGLLTVLLPMPAALADDSKVPPPVQFAMVVRTPAGGAAAAARPHRPLIAVGFAGNRLLGSAVRDKLRALGRYQVDTAAEIPTDPLGLFVSGRITAMKHEGRHLRCSAQFFLLGQPGPAMEWVVTASATAANRADCIAAMASQIVQRTDSWSSQAER